MVTRGRQSTCSRPWIRPLQLTALQYLRRAVTPHPATYTRASLVVQMVKNLPTVWETWVWSRSGRLPGEGNGNPLQYSCLENPMDGGAWWATVQGVAKSETWLTQRLTPQSSPFCVNIQNSSNKVICRFLVALLKAVTHKVHECFLVKIFNDTDKHKDFCSLFSFGPLSRENFSYQYGVYVSRRTFSLHICGYGNKWKL